MAKVRFQTTAAVGLALLTVLPGVSVGLIEAPRLDPLLAGGLPEGFQGPVPEALAPLVSPLANQAFVGSFAQLSGLPGGELASLQPTLESLLRFYAQDRGFVLSPPRTPEPPKTDALAPALLALGAAFGQPVPPDQLEEARALPPELQQALARIVLAYLQAARSYTEALAGLTRADLQAMARGEPPSTQPDGGRIASAALLVDRAVRESTPALRKWALLMAIEERTQHPELRDVSLDSLLRSGARTQSLHDTVDMASVLQGWQPVQAGFTPTSQHPSEAMARFYHALGVPVLPDVDAAFRLLDRQGPAHQALVITLADGLRQALGPMLEAERLVSPGELERAYAELERLDLEALRAADPSAMDQARLEAILQVLARADQSVQRRLQAAGIIADAMGLAGALAPHLAAEELLGPNPAPPGGYQATDAGPVPTDGIDVQVPNVGVCRIGDGEQGPAVNCAGVSAPLPNLKCVPDNCQPDPGSYTLTLYLDENNDTRVGEDEVLLRTPPLADQANDIVFRDPYGFILVGGENRTFYDTRYGNVNVSLRVENGTIKEERRVLFNSAAASVVLSLYDLGDAVLPSRDTNATLFEPQYNGFVNLTFNPHNHTLAIVDLGGPDVYTNRAGGADSELRLYNSTFSERVTRTVGRCTASASGEFGTAFSPGGGVFILGPVIVVAGECNNPPAGNPPIGGNQVIVDFGDPLAGNLSNYDSGTPQFLFLNATNLSLPLRLGVVLDTSGDDQYVQEWNYTLGASDRGLGILWDAERCQADNPGPNCARLSQGNDVYVAPDNTTGAGTNRGVGILLDEAGDDTYQGRNYSLGSGSERGIGLAVDLAGNDRWHGENYTMGFGGRELFLRCGVYWDPAVTDARTINDATCPRGPFYDGVQASAAAPNAVERASARAGLGVLLERRGNDHYAQANRTSNQGKGWPALGLLLDLSGRDQGLQTNLTTTSELGTLAVGYQENTLLAPPRQTNPQANGYFRFLHNGQGGGLVVDAEVTDTSALQDRATAAPGSGVGMSAVEVEGRANTFRCNGNTDNTASVFNLVFSGTPSNNDPTNRRCVDVPGEAEGSPRNWQTLSGQEFLLRIPGLFGLGGLSSNDGLEAPVNVEEHLLQVDLAGNDRYRGPFGGAQTPNVSAFDMEGFDGTPATPENSGVPQSDPNMAPLYQAGLLAPVALALDLQGADFYDARTLQLGHNATTGQPVRRNATTPTLGGGYAGMGFLYDMGLAAGPASTRFGLPSGCARGGLDDVYVGHNRTLGYGAMFGVGVVVDQDGDDCYLALGGDTGANASAPSLSMGMGQLGGIGALLDARGNDTYMAGNLSQGAAILEQVNKNLPRRVNNYNFHDSDNPAQSNLEPNAAQVQNAFGAFYDGRGDDGYAFGNASQGWGELHPTVLTSDSSGLPVVSTVGTGPRQVLGGLFIDDGFGLDRYANHSRVSINLSSLAGHKDNSFWCASPRIQEFGPLNGTLGSALGANGPAAGQALADLGARVAENLTMLGGLVQQNLSRLGAQADAGHGESANATLSAAAALVAQNLTQLGQQMRDLLRAQAEVANAQLQSLDQPDAASQSSALVNSTADTVNQTLRDAGQQASDAIAAQGTLAGSALATQGRELNRTLAAQGEAVEQRLRDLGETVQGGAGPGTGMAFADQARDTAVFGPNRNATCLRIELDTTAKSVDLGSLGRGFDNLDFFANFLLAMGTFGQDYIKLRDVLSAPVVEPVKCYTRNDTTPRAACQLDGSVVLTTSIAWGVKALVYNAGQLLIYACAKASGLAAACSNTLSSFNGTVNLTNGAQASTGAAYVDQMRRVEFAAREPGTDREVLLGAMDRRKGLGCALTLEGDERNFSIPDGCGNVTFPNGDIGLKRTMLKWDTRALVNASDGLPELRTPDGPWDVVVRAYFQPDNVSGPNADNERELRRHLGDEYSANNNQTELPFYPGYSVTRVAVDNPPVVYQLEYKDVSLATRDCQPDETPAQCAADQPYHTLGLNLTASPRFNTTQPGYADQDAHPEYRYNITAELLPVEALRGLEPVTFRCSAPGDQGPLFLPLSCAEPPGNRSQQPGARAILLGGWSEQAVFGSLSDGSYLLRVNVTEPAHFLNATGATPVIQLPERTTVRCFVFHGGPLVESPHPEGACEGELFVDSVAPQVVAAFDPSRGGADGVSYVNRSVAYPEGRSMAANDDAVIPLRFDTLNAAEKRSRVVEFSASALLRLSSPDPADVRFNVTTGTFTATRGNLTLRVCADDEPDRRAACLRRNATDPEERVDFNRSYDVYSVEVAAGARDLAGNRDPLVPRVVEIPLATPDDPDAPPLQVRAAEPEASGLLDVDGPVAALCQTVTTLKQMPPDLPRIRTRERLLPMPWRPVLNDAGDDACIGAIQPSDNRGVEAVLIIYNVTEPGAPQAPQNLTRVWQPPGHQQATRLAVFDFDARDAADLVNNRTLHYAARALDLAGNLQPLDRGLLLRRTTYDIRPPSMEALNLTPSHQSIAVKWFARDLEAGGKVVRSYLHWGALGDNGADNLTQLANATQIGNLAFVTLDGLDPGVTHSLQAFSLDDVGNLASLPVVHVTTDPLIRLEIASPRPGDILHGAVPLVVRVSDLRGEPELNYTLTFVAVSPDGNATLVVPVESFTRRECVPGEQDCPNATSVITFVRTIQTARLPDTREGFLRIAVTSATSPGKPLVASVGPLLVDNTPPVTTLTVVAQGGPEWFRSAALLTLQPRDNITQVVSTEYSFDNFTFLPYNASAPPVQDREGSLPFFWRSVDQAGNAEPLNARTINVDRQRPVGELRINDGAAATNEPEVDVFLRASDALSGIANATLEAAGRLQTLEHPERFAAGRHLRIELPSGQGEQRVRVRLTDRAGNVQELKASIVIDTLPPEITDVRVEQVGHTSATLSWRTSEEATTRVEYGPKAASALANRFQADERNRVHLVTLQGLRPSLGYQFRVVALDALGNRATQRGTFDTLPDVTPPGAPRDLRAEDLRNGAVRLDWRAAFDDVGIDHYIVFRGVAGQLEEVGRVAELLYIDDQGMPGVGYDYAVQAVDLAGQQGPRSGLASARATTRPVLLDPKVTPDKGTATQLYTYSVVVRDADGDAPLDVRVRLGNSTFALRPQFEGRADFARGVLYSVSLRLPTTTLSSGFPTYQFEVDDGQGVVVGPELPASGPAVLGAFAIIPGLSAASNLLGLPGFEFVLAALAAGAALLVLRRRRRG